jgi:hypothetical protein
MADLTVESHEAPHDKVVAEIIRALNARLTSSEEISE